MTAAKPEPKPARRGLWLVVVVIGLLAVTTWDVLRNSNHSSPAALRRAAFDGDEATVRRLVKAHPEWIDSVGSAKAPTSAAGGLLEVTLIALGKPAPSPTSPEGVREELFLELEASGSTPLMHAATRKHLGVARLLVDAGANLRADRWSGWPLVALARYATELGNTNFLVALKARGAMLHSGETEYEWGLLHAAVQSGRAEVLRFLIAHGHSVNGRDRSGGTPLHLAVHFSRLDLVQMLATNGADLSLVAFFRGTPLDEARKAAATNPSSNATAVATWLEAFAATNQPPAKPAP